MTYEEYKDVLLQEIRTNLMNETKIRTTEVEKNNGNTKEGFAIDNGNDVAPVFYFDALYERYTKGESVKEQAQKITGYATLPQDDEVTEFANILLKGKWDDIKDKIKACVVNLEWNREQLEELPHIEYLDLAIIFRIVFANAENGIASTLISHKLLKNWNVTEDELFWHGLANLQKEKFTIDTLDGVLRKKGACIDEEIDCPMYMITNESGVNGAVSIMRTDLLDAFAKEKKHNLYIIPCSIHELLLVPTDAGISKIRLRNMLLSVNYANLEKEMRLSESIYYYSRRSGCVERVA